MTAHAVFDVADTFLGMLCADLRRLVLVTAITGVAFEAGTGVTGRAGCLVRPGQCEEP